MGIANPNIEAGLIAQGWPSLAQDLAATSPDLGRPARVAIASYEFTGIVRNGGIGTACTALASALVADGHEVDLVFTGWADDPSDEAFEGWREHYASLGMRLGRPDLAKVAHCDTTLYNTSHSLALYRLLRDRDRDRPYDVIHFVESLGHGFYSLAAKRQGVAFQDATTVVGVHSPRRWLAEAHGTPFDDPVELGDAYMEQRSIELADVVVSPSAHMLDWLCRRGTELPERSYVQQYVTDFASVTTGRGTSAPVEELVFFGRLEQRKGLLVFCDALDEIAHGRGAREPLRRITLLGKQIPFGSELSSGDYVMDRAERWPWEVEVIDTLDRDAALAYLRAPGRLAVMPSLLDNSPNTVYEAIGLGLSFLASRGGGTAELVHPDDFERVTYDPRDDWSREIDPGDPSASRATHSGRVLAASLLEALATPSRPARFAVEPNANRATHVAWHRRAAACERPTRTPAVSAPTPVDVRDLATVAMDESNELLLVVDPAALPDWALASTLAAAAAAHPSAGFLTTLGSFEVLTAGDSVERVYLPVGGTGAAGLLGNSSGAGVMLARRDALRRIGALDGEPAALGYSVADLLAEAALAGEQIDVIPEVLYHLPPEAAPGGSVTRARERLSALRPYCLALGREAGDIAAVARRMVAEESWQRARAERVEQELRATQERLAEVMGSRSWRFTGSPRRVAAGVRRFTRRPT